MLCGLKEVVVGYWLKEIVKGADLEPLDSILAESSREDDSCAFRKHPGKLHPAEAWHLNVAEQEINRLVLYELESVNHYATYISHSGMFSEVLILRRQR